MICSLIGVSFAGTIVSVANSLKAKPEGSSWTAGGVLFASGAPSMLLTAVMVIIVSASSASAGTSSVNWLPSDVLSDTLPPDLGIILLAVCFISSCTITLSGVPGVTKSIAGPLLFLEPDRSSNLHDSETARSRRTDNINFEFFICLSVHFRAQSSLTDITDRRDRMQE